MFNLIVMDTILTVSRGELLQVTDLVSVLSKGALANANRYRTCHKRRIFYLQRLPSFIFFNHNSYFLNSATGMVWKTNENVQMLPLSNKAAYRRHMMEVS